MIALEPANEDLRLKAKQWLADERENVSLGYRKGVDGVFDAKLTFASALSREGRAGVLGIYKDEEAVGYVLLSESTPFRKTMRFQMFLEPKSRRQGLGTAALAQLADKVLLSGGVHRLETEFLAKNATAKRWLKGEEFTQESFRKHSWWSDGSPHSTVVMRLLAPDWRRIKKARRESQQVEEVA